MEPLRRLLQQLMQVWQGLTVPRRIGLALTTALSIAAIVAVGFWAAQPEYRMLYSNLSVEDAGAVTAKLQAQNVPFRLSTGGTTILVPADQVQQLRLDLAADGLPTKGGKGFEVFDESPLGMTPFMQHINYGRALQTELAKSIMRLDPVAFARVHIVRPEPTPFIREQKPATASVVLWLKPGTTLSRSMANGIVALVAHSVEGLAPDQVTLLDSAGHILSDQRNAEGGSLPGSHLEHRRDLEAYLASKAEEMLAQLLGPSRAIVRVAAEVNFKSLHEKREAYNPEEKVVRKETVTSGKNTGPAPIPRGMAGVASNNGRPVPPSASTALPGSQEESIETEYAISKTETDREDRASQIERLTVAAMVDLSRAEGAEGGTAGQVMTTKEAEEIIKQAVGFKIGRDEIKVTDVKLAGAAALTSIDPELVQMQRWQTYMNLVRYASLGLASVVALVLGFLVLRRLRLLTPPVAAAPPPKPEREQLLGDFASLAERNPEIMARLLASWLEKPEQPAKKAAA